MVAYARVFVGVHHIIDVAVSIVISVIVGIILSLTVYRKFGQPLSQKVYSVIYKGNHKSITDF